LRAINSTDEAKVVWVADRRGVRYHAIAPGRQVNVDSVGEGNPYADAVGILDHSCALEKTLTGDFSRRGTITIEAASVAFVPELTVPGEDEDGTGAPTCEEALATAG
jgi:hypothetical protein